MTEPSLSAVFGASATQNATTITISKSDLSAVGLTPDVSNTAESLLASIVLLAKQSLLESSFETNIDQSVTVTNGFDSIVSRDDGTGTFVSYRQVQLTVNLHSLDSFTVDPDDY